MKPRWKLMIVLVGLALAGGVRGFAAARLTVRDAEVTAGGVGSVPVDFATSEEVVAAQFDVVFASTNIVQRGAVAGSALSGHVVHFHERAPGVERVVIYSAANVPLPSGLITGISIGAPQAMPAGIISVTITNVILTTRAATPVSQITVEPGSLVIQRPGLVRFTSITRSGEGFVELTLTGGAIGERYITEASENFAGWMPISVDPVPPGGTIFIRDDGAAGLNKRFYRARPEAP